MRFKDQNMLGEERAGKKEKREQAPAIQTQVSTRVSTAQITGLSRAIF